MANISNEDYWDESEDELFVDDDWPDDVWDDEFGDCLPNQNHADHDDDDEEEYDDVLDYDDDEE